MKTKILRIMGLLVGIIASLIIELFYQGGVLFMSIITILLIGTIVSYFKYPEKIKLFGNMSLAVGILGEYIARIHKKLLNKPSYIVSEKINTN